MDFERDERERGCGLVDAVDEARVVGYERHPVLERVAVGELLGLGTERGLLAAHVVLVESLFDAASWVRDLARGGAGEGTHWRRRSSSWRPGECG